MTTRAARQSLRHVRHSRSSAPRAIRWRRPQSVAAEGALELFLAAMAKRAGTYTGARVADFQAVQIKVARARSLIDSARHLVRQSAIVFHDMAARNEVPDLETKLRFRAHMAFAVGRGARGVETLWSCYGAQGLYTRDPLQRHLRDVLAMRSTSPSISTSRGRPTACTRSAVHTRIRPCDRGVPAAVAIRKAGGEACFRLAD
jgi:hypothetical protein